MSSAEAETNPAGGEDPADEEGAALERLDEAVRAAVERLRAMEDRLHEAKARNRDLEELLERFRAGEDDPERMAKRVARLTEENEMLRERLDRGRGAVERILARIRFLRERE